MTYGEILEELSSEKCKLTSPRKEILKVLVRARIHLSAKEVFDRLDLGDGRSRYKTYRRDRRGAEKHNSYRKIIDLSLETFVFD